MSSCDSALLAVASIVSTNLLPLVKRNPSEKARLVVARWAIPAAGTLAIVFALKFKVVFNLILDANILLLACVAMPFIVGVYWPRANRSGGVAAMAAGLIAWLLTEWLAPTLPGDLIGMLASLVALLVVAPLTQRSDPPRPLLDGEGNVVEFKNRLGVLPLFRKI